LFVGCGLSILQQLSGINAFTMFTNKIFMGNNTKLTLEAYESSRNLTVIFGVVNLVIPFLCSFITPKVGRKTLLIVGNTLCMVCLIIFPFSDTILPILSKIAIFGYAVGYGISLGPIVWMYIPEILPDVGVGVAVLANWVFAVIVIQTFPLLPFGSYNFLFFGGFCALGLVFITLCVKETLGKTPAEIAEMYYPVEKPAKIQFITPTALNTPRFTKPYAQVTDSEISSPVSLMNMSKDEPIPDILSPGPYGDRKPLSKFNPKYKKDQIEMGSPSELVKDYDTPAKKFKAESFPNTASTSGGSKGSDEKDLEKMAEKYLSPDKKRYSSIPTEEDDIEKNAI